MRTTREYVYARPYLLLARDGAGSHLLSSSEAQRLIDDYAIVRATGVRVTLQGEDGCYGIVAATRGTGRAFDVMLGTS